MQAAGRTEANMLLLLWLMCAQGLWLMESEVQDMHACMDVSCSQLAGGAKVVQRKDATNGGVTGLTGMIKEV